MAREDLDSLLRSMTPNNPLHPLIHYAARE